MSFLNLISFFGIFGLCAIAWLFSENRHPRYFPWRVVIAGLLLQFVLGALVFIVPGTRDLLQVFSTLLNVLFEAADAGARFIFGGILVPLPGEETLLLAPLVQGEVCSNSTVGEVISGYCGVRLGYIFALRALPTVIFFSALVALLYNLGILQVITKIFAQIFYRTMRLSGAESLSGASNIFVGIEAAIVVRPFLPKMTRSELCTILACCFGTTASSVLALYSAFLRPVFPNILGHLVSASIMAIPACFLLSKILIPEAQTPLTAAGIPDETRAEQLDPEGNYGETEHLSPMDATVAGAWDGLKMAASIVAVLIAVLGLVYLINQFFVVLANLADSNIGFLQPIGQLFRYVTIQNILGALFLPLTLLTGVSLSWNELWQSSVLIGQRLFLTEVPSYQDLAVLTQLPAETRVLTDRALLIVSYALSGFAHLASVGIFVGGISALAPTRRKEIVSLAWKALFVGTLATYMIACIAGVFDTGSPTILGRPADAPIPTAPAIPSPAPATPSPAPTITPAPSP
ncbi:nucleoside:proton symporter [Leptolyngbya sp. NK1-12]|uniref:Nucleoside:proton symporter n=1 Tax=Leptolyngbya sp. NK1-12 TaxID=2547451 RepID=A0AA96WS46_9CYAN|nr:nucleoside:proton symporter [Leptolyngbya sp. NK1-12]